LLLELLLAAACSRSKGPGLVDAGGVPLDAAVAPAAGPAEAGPEAAAPTRPKTAAKAGELVEIPSHTMLAGSLPGDEGRDPGIEPVGAPIALSAFSIDALAYPNDPAQPGRTNVTRSEAERLCSEQGKRLCTEVEWEAACKGPSDDLYATGPAWDPSCEQAPATCASGYGVRAMGVLREWTSSAVEATQGQGEGPVVRGGGVDRPGGPRCARRERGAEPAGARDVGFRCCSGPMPGVMMPRVASYPPFKKATLPLEQLARMVAGATELARLGGDIAMFDPGDNPYLRRSKAEREDYVFTPLPLLWSPEAGMQVLLVAGRGKEGSFVTAWWPLPGGGYRLASSFLMLGEVAPVALAFRSTERSPWWTTCWKCSGETGRIVLRPDHRVVILPD
jgi:hypothetical protein